MKCADCPNPAPRCGGECAESRYLCELARSENPVHRAHALALLHRECEREPAAPASAVFSPLRPTQSEVALVPQPREPTITCLYLDDSRCHAGRDPLGDGYVWPQWCVSCLGAFAVTDRLDETTTDA